MLRYDTISPLAAKGVPIDRMIMLLDPIDLSREQRTFWLGKALGKIKLDVDVSDVSLSADFAPAPDENRVKEQFKAKGVDLQTPKAATLREFMNALISSLNFRGVKTVLLEDFLAKNPPKEGGARAVCPECGRFRKMRISDSTPCCGAPWTRVRSYIPERNAFKQALASLGLASPSKIIGEKAGLPTMYESYLLNKKE